MPAHIRPTPNLVRKAIFDILGQDLEGDEVLELFAGSGALGLEALSYGADRVVLVEKDEKCLKVIETNIGLLKRGKAGAEAVHCEVYGLDAFAAVKFFAQKGRKFDIVLLDPPYDRELGKKALNHLEAYDILHATSVVVVQHIRREILPERSGRIVLFREEDYGATRLSFYRIES